MRKHSDHKKESDEANNMSWLTMLKCKKDIALLVALLRKWQKRTRVPSECQSREKRGKARPRRCTVRSYEGTQEGHEFDSELMIISPRVKMKRRREKGILLVHEQKEMWGTKMIVTYPQRCFSPCLLNIIRCCFRHDVDYGSGNNSSSGLAWEALQITLAGASRYVFFYFKLVTS